MIENVASKAIFLQFPQCVQENRAREIDDVQKIWFSDRPTSGEKFVDANRVLLIHKFSTNFGQHFRHILFSLKNASEVDFLLS